MKTENDLLILVFHLGILRAMTRLIVLIVGIVWASLLLISWGGAEDISRQHPAAPATERSGL